MLKRRFAAWIRQLRDDAIKVGAIPEWGSQQELARRLGVEQGDLSHWLKWIDNEGSEKKSPNLTLDRFEEVLARVRPGVPLHDVILEITEGRDILRPPSNLSALEQRYVELWERLDAMGPHVRERVLKNLEDAVELRLLPVIAEAARAIINDGPAQAAIPVAKILSEYREPADRATTRRRKRLAREYAQIGS